MTINPISLNKTLTSVVTNQSQNYGNILSRIQELVCKISGQLQRLSEETSVKSQKLKGEYRVSAAKSADFERKIGKNYLLQSSQSLISTLAIAALSPKFDLKAVEPLLQKIDSEILGSGWKWREGNLRGAQETEKSIYNLRQTEISNEGTKSGEAKDLIQELQGLLSSIRDMYRKASS